MTVAFAYKLSLTAAVLGCRTRKELAARFREVNPLTEFDVERSYKWLQGRALPRSRQVYDEIGKLIGTERSGTWLAACAPEAFVDELCTLFSADRDTLIAAADAFAGARVTAASTGQGNDYLHGVFVTYSWAWSPYYRDHLVRGVFKAHADRRGQMPVEYAEALPTGAVSAQGRAVRAGSGLQAHLTWRGGRDWLFATLLVPGRPGNVLCGQLSGNVVQGPSPQPSATRIVMVRCRSEIPADGSGAYLAPSASRVADDLVAHGFPIGRAVVLAEALLTFLGAAPGRGPDLVTPDDLGALVRVVEGAAADAAASAVPGVVAGVSI